MSWPSTVPGTLLELVKRWLFLEINDCVCGGEPYESHRQCCLAHGDGQRSPWDSGKCGGRAWTERWGEGLLKRGAPQARAEGGTLQRGFRVPN